MPEVISTNISTEKGTVKRPVAEGIELLEDHGARGDAHAGGGIRQLSMLAMESIERMRALGADVSPGDFAENITTRGIELHTLPVGTRLRCGDTLLEVTQIGKKCHKGCEILKQVGDCIMPREGIFVRIIKGGHVQPVQSIALED